MKIFLTDGSSDGFFTAVFYAYGERDCVITSDEHVQLSFDSEIVRVIVDPGKCARVRNGIDRYDPQAVRDIALVLRSCDAKREQTAFNYVRRLFAERAAIRRRLSLAEVIEFNEILKKVTGELHNMKGFLRFMQCGGAFYAPYSPDNDITELIMPHFAARFSAEKFVIHDVKRKLAGIYNGDKWIIAYADMAEVQLSDGELAFETLWKKYYNAANIAERPHEKQMRGYMPARYWKFMPEKKD